jgi:hypothetical protein
MSEFFTHIACDVDYDGTVMSRIWFAPELMLFARRRRFIAEVALVARQNREMLRQTPLYCSLPINPQQDIAIELRCEITPGRAPDVFVRLSSGHEDIAEALPEDQQPTFPESDRFRLPPAGSFLYPGTRFSDYPQGEWN